MIVPKKVVKFGAKCRDLDRQYEQNNNDELDNGVYNQCADDDDDDAVDPVSRSVSKEDSLKGSFKNTELSSDDEHAELQVEEAHMCKEDQQKELREFEKQIQQQFIKYEEKKEDLNPLILDKLD